MTEPKGTPHDGRRVTEQEAFEQTETISTGERDLSTDKDPPSAPQPAARFADIPRPGDVLEGRYEVLSVLGEGGFGVVYKARQVATEQLVALKVLLPSRLTDTAESATARERFRREMKVVGELRHRNIVRLIDSGSLPDGALFMVLEFLEGRELSDLIREHAERGETMPAGEVKRLMAQVLSALAEAHGKGYVHRDLKPQNIMITRDGMETNAVVLDFGIAGVTEPAQGTDYVKLTRTRQAIGTLAYMAPEQLMGQRTPQTDIYAWGLIVLECLTGHVAVSSDTPYGAVLIHASPNPIPIPQVVRQHPFGQILARAVAKKLDERYQSVRELYREVVACDVSGLHVPWAPVPEVPLAGTADDTDPPPGQGISTGRLSQPESAVVEASPAPTGSAPWLWIALGVLALIAVVGWLALSGGKEPQASGADEQRTPSEQSDAAGADVGAVSDAGAGLPVAAVPDAVGIVDASNAPRHEVAEVSANAADSDASEAAGADTAPVDVDTAIATLKAQAFGRMREHEYDAAITLLEEALALRDEPELHASMALALEKSDRPCDALTHYREAYKLSRGALPMALKRATELSRQCPSQ